MSRSYHSNRRKLAEQEKWDYAQEEKGQEGLARVREELALKRRVKALIKTERREVKPDLVQSAWDKVAIRVEDESEFVHYPAGAEDIRGLLRRLPGEAAAGVSEIVLCLGKQEAEEYWTEQEIWPGAIVEEAKRDPFTSRISTETFPGVYMSGYWGIYYLQPSQIQLYGYVYKDGFRLQKIVEFYLKIRMLMTLLHEIGHHFDDNERRERGRWRGDEVDKNEIYAEGVQYRWLYDCLIPFLKEQYPKELYKLWKWMKTEIGVAPPLELIIGDPRVTAKGGLTKVFGNTGGDFVDFVDFVGKIMAGEDRTEAQIEYACDLHYIEEYEWGLKILEKVVEKNPNNFEAVTLQGDIFIHQEKFAEGKEKALMVLATEPENLEAMHVLMDAYTGLKEWKILEETADEFLKIYLIQKQRKKEYGYSTGLYARARARLEQHDYAGLLKDLDEIGGLKGARGNPIGLLRHRAQKILEALEQQLTETGEIKERETAELIRRELTTQIEKKTEYVTIIWPRSGVDENCCKVPKLEGKPIGWV